MIRRKGYAQFSHMAFDLALVDYLGTGAYLPASASRHSAPSSNGKTPVSDTVYRGSNPRGASSIFARTQKLGLSNLYPAVLTLIFQFQIALVRSQTV